MQNRREQKCGCSLTYELALCGGGERARAVGEGRQPRPSPFPVPVSAPRPAPRFHLLPLRGFRWYCWPRSCRAVAWSSFPSQPSATQLRARKPPHRRDGCLEPSAGPLVAILEPAPLFGTCFTPSGASSSDKGFLASLARGCWGLQERAVFICRWLYPSTHYSLPPSPSFLAFRGCWVPQNGDHGFM